jgi:hypothetical protein
MSASAAPEKLMRRSLALALLAAYVQASNTNHAVEYSDQRAHDDSADVLVDKLASKANDEIFGNPLQATSLDHTTLGKAGHVSQTAWSRNSAPLHTRSRMALGKASPLPGSLARPSPFLASAAHYTNAATVRPAQRTIASAIRFDASVPDSEQAASSSHFLDVLKFDGQVPSFDVLAKTKEYVFNTAQNENVATAPEEIYADDYVLRGPVIGPITRQDLSATAGSFDLGKAFPDLASHPFGFTIDPENPFRCLWFERWTATHTGPVKVGPLSLQATGKKVETPVHVNSVVWNPEGKLVYSSVGNVVDRHEGNTDGQAAVFGLLKTAGVPVAGGPGSMALRMQQRLAHKVNLAGRAWSRDEDLPKWWTSRSRGADPNDAAASGKDR